MRLNEEPLSGNHLAIAASRETAAMSPYDLPDGWVVEEVPRKNDSRTDKVLLLFSIKPKFLLFLFFRFFFFKEQSSFTQEELGYVSLLGVKSS